MKPQQSGPSERKTHRAWAAALMLVACATVQAGDADSERESLARIENELAVVQQMVAAASRDAPPSPRGGSQQPLNAPMQPRPVEPLRGDYRQ